MSDHSIYLDYAATTPLDPHVRAAMEPYFSEVFYNPSANYRAAQRVHADLEAARARIGHWLGARPTELVFTAGATEANNLAISGIMSRYPDATMVTSAIEHESVLAPASKYTSVTVQPTPDGIITPEVAQAAVGDTTVLVSIMYANNEIGAVQPIREIGRLIADIRRDRLKRGVTLPLYFHTDAAQAGNYLDLHVSRLGVDLMSLNGSKVYGPKQTGALYVRTGIELMPLILGGGQESGLRSGTENVAGSIGFSVALDRAQTMRHDETERLQQLQRQFMDELEKIPGASINGSKTKRLANNVHVTVPATDNERLLIGLDEAGIMAAAGSACSASSDEPSHVLTAIGLDDAAARSSLRFSLGRSTTGQDITDTVRALRHLLER